MNNIDKRITIIECRLANGSPEEGDYYVVLAAPHTDSATNEEIPKPTSRIASGSWFRETDTGNVYSFDKTAGSWGDPQFTLKSGS